MQPVMFRGGVSEPNPIDAHSCRFGDLVFIGGLSAFQAGTGTIRPEAKLDPNFPFDGSAIERQTESILNQLSAILEETESDPGHVAKAQVLLEDLSDFHGFHDVWRAYFGNPSEHDRPGGWPSIA